MGFTPQRYKRFGALFSIPATPSNAVDDEWGVVLPQQTRIRSSWLPEHYLLLAVLADAKRLALFYAVYGTQLDYKVRREPKAAYEWLMSDSERVMGYRWCCQHVGGDPEDIRKAVREMTDRKTRAVLREARA